MLAVIILIGSITCYRMFAHLLQRHQSILSFALCNLIGRNNPIVERDPIVMIQKIVAIDHEIQLVRNTEHLNFTIPCGRVVGKILVQYKISNSYTKAISQLINFILNIEFGFPITNSARKRRFAAVFHRAHAVRPLFCFFRLFDFSIQYDKSIDSVVSCILIATFVGYRSKQRFNLLEKRLIVRFLPYKIQAHRKMISNLIIVPALPARHGGVCRSPRAGADRL